MRTQESPVLTKAEAHAIAASLLACPFCGAKPTPSIRGEGEVTINPKARCETEDCWGARLPVIGLDVPSQVSAWNTRSGQHDQGAVNS
jgi:hypothetical protein